MRYVEIKKKVHPPFRLRCAANSRIQFNEHVSIFASLLCPSSSKNPPRAVTHFVSQSGPNPVRYIIYSIPQNVQSALNMNRIYMNDIEVLEPNSFRLPAETTGCNHRLRSQLDPSSMTIANGEAKYDVMASSFGGLRKAVTGCETLLHSVPKRSACDWKFCGPRG